MRQPLGPFLLFVLASGIAPFAWAGPRPPCGFRAGESRPSAPEPPAIASLVSPKTLKGMMEDRKVLAAADLGDGIYSFRAAMRVNATLRRTREVLMNYALYSRLVPYVDRTDYDPRTRVLDLEGGIWKFRLHSYIRFEERGDRWIRYRIVGGHFRGLEGNVYFESVGEKGTLVYFDGSQEGDEWPPKLVITRGAEIVFEFTANRMRKYLESGEDHGKDPPDDDTHDQVPQPRSHL